MTKIKYLFNLLLVMIFGLGGASCAIAPAKMVPLTYSNQVGAAKWPDTELQKRFGEYWYNRFIGQVEDSYRMENPYFIEMVELHRYNSVYQHAERNKSVRIEISDIQSETDYLVYVYCKLMIQGGGGEITETSLLDQWVYVNSRWYHVIKDSFLFKMP